MAKTGTDEHNREPNKTSKSKDRLGSKDTLVGGEKNDTIKMCSEEDLPYDSLESSDIDSESRQIWAIFGSTDPQSTGKYSIEGDNGNDTLKSESNFDAGLYQTWLSLHNIMAKNLRASENALENEHKPPSEH
ncbi:hypothetical protein CYANOKiyG1_68210 [Okeania sp. KiyG1]|nr:hypothetical protein CYANOKiyG1_68210 [Okeania sp. KiyG1]